MKTRTIATLVACSFLLAFLQLVAALGKPLVAILCGGLLAFLASVLLRFFEVDFENAWVAPCVPICSSVAGVAIPYFAVGRDKTIWFAPLAAAIVAALMVEIRRRDSRRCGLCNSRIGSGLAFNCPRCELLACENCWVFERCRCRLCEQNHVPIFSPDGRWWDKQFGPRSSYGRCQLCLGTADEVDLRVCGKCGRPQCRECWDSANGQCSKCHWIVEDLPPRLRDFMAAPNQPERHYHT